MLLLLKAAIVNCFIFTWHILGKLNMLTLCSGEVTADLRSGKLQRIPRFEFGDFRGFWKVLEAVEEMERDQTDLQLQILRRIPGSVLVVGSSVESV